MRNIHPKIRETCEALGVPYRIEQKRDHYFLRVGSRLICVGNNSSGPKKFGQVHRTVREIEKAAGDAHALHIHD